MSDITEQPTVAEMVDVTDPRTPAEILRAAYEQAQQTQVEPKDVQLYGYGEPFSELHVTFMPIEDYEEIREGIRNTLKRKGLRPALREEELAKEMLRRAAAGSYSLINGQRREFDVPLGLELYEYLELDKDDESVVRAVNDSAAIERLFLGNTVVMMAVAGEVDRWIRQGGREAEEDVLGN